MRHQAQVWQCDARDVTVTASLALGDTGWHWEGSGTGSGRPRVLCVSHTNRNEHMTTAVRCAIAFDIDGTLLPSDEVQVERLRRYAVDAGVDMHVNTARHRSYCDFPSNSIQIANMIGTTPSQHHCFVEAAPTIEASKVINMQHIQAQCGILHPECVVLIDDVAENVDAARSHGFSAVQVDASVGIQQATVNEVIRILEHCGVSRNRWCRRRAAVTTAALLVGVLLLWRVACQTRCARHGTCPLQSPTGSTTEGPTASIPRM